MTFADDQLDVLKAAYAFDQQSPGRWMAYTRLSEFVGGEISRSRFSQVSSTLKKKGLLDIYQNHSSFNVKITGEGVEYFENLENSSGEAAGKARISRIVSGPAPVETLVAVDEFVTALSENNEYRSLYLEDVDREIAQIEAGRRLLEGPAIDLELVERVLVETVRNIVVKTIDTTLGRLADNLLTIIIVLVANA